MAVSLGFKLCFLFVCLVQPLKVYGLKSASLGFEKYVNNKDNQIKEIEEFYIGNIKCWRYCVTKTMTNGKGDESQFLNLLWEFDKNSTGAGIRPSTSKTVLIPKIFTNEVLNDTKTQNDKKCRKFLMLGCDIPETGANILFQKETLLRNLYPTDKESDKSNNIPKRFDILMKTSEVDGSMETKFNIENALSGMEIIVSGNITKINLQVPVVEGQDENFDYPKEVEGESLKKNFREFERLKTQKRETDDNVYNDKYENTYVRFEDEAHHETIPHKKDIDYDPEEVINEIEFAETFNKSDPSIKFVEPRLNEPLETDDLLGADFDRFTRRKYITVDVSSESKLVLERNGQQNDAKIFFEITNNYPFPVSTNIQGFSTDFVVPKFIKNSFDIKAGEKLKVLVLARIPPFLNIDYGTVTLVTNFYVLSLYTSAVTRLMSVEKSAYLFFKKSEPKYKEDIRPNLRYYFNNNCAGNTKSEYCSKTWWSVNIEAEDFNSGLKVVTSSPRGIMPDANYISGTKSLQKFYYTNTCCNLDVIVEAENVYGKVESRIIDVREWDNLSPGEIAAIVLGALIILLLIILIAVSVMYCIQKRQQLDLPYTQRYSSRPSQRTEGTNF